MRISTLILFGFILSLNSCDEGAKDNSSCGCDGLSVEVISDLEGVVKEEVFGFVISSDLDNKRYGECFDLSDGFKVDGLQVKFSGERKATCPNVKYFSIPFKLMNIVWSDQSSDSVKIISSGGTYWVKVISECTIQDTIEINYIDCP